jgi:hypothetical protein
MNNVSTTQDQPSAGADSDNEETQSTIDTAVLMEPYFQRHLGETPLNIAPERSAELMSEVFQGRIWDLVATKGCPPGGIQPFESYPEFRAISVSYSGLAMVWCIARYGVFMLDVVRSARGTIEGPTDIGQAWSELKGYLEYATALRQEDRAWPNKLERPRLDTGNRVIEETNDMFFGAVGWILLHEIAHVKSNHESMSHRSIEDENEADDFAADWVFKDVPTERQREFRILVVGVALAWLMLFAPVGGDTKHPPAYVRVMRVASYFEAAKDSVALEAVAHLFKALFFPTMTPPTFETPDELFHWTVMKMRELAS